MTDADEAGDEMMRSSLRQLSKEHIYEEFTKCDDEEILAVINRAIDSFTDEVNKYN